MSLDEIKSALPNLTDAELVALRDAIDAERHQRHGDDDEDAFVTVVDTY